MTYSTRRTIAFTALMLSALLYLHQANATSIPDTSSIGASFDAFWVAARDRPFDEQEAAWDRLVEQPRHDTYASVVWESRDNPRWKESKDQLLRLRFAEYSRVGAKISATARALQLDMPIQLTRFRKLFPDAPARPPVQLLLAPNFDAKSGVLDDGTPVLIFAVDSLALENADMSVLFPHEFFHLYHALHSGIQNDGVMHSREHPLCPPAARGSASAWKRRPGPTNTPGKLG